jgi:hypothetical protein
MLAAMTYNTLLITVLILGYFTGDYIYFTKIAAAGAKLVRTDSSDCH